MCGDEGIWIVALHVGERVVYVSVMCLVCHLMIGEINVEKVLLSTNFYTVLCKTKIERLISCLTEGAVTLTMHFSVSTHFALSGSL
jgi:hypothetical protein